MKGSMTKRDFNALINGLNIFIHPEFDSIEINGKETIPLDEEDKQLLRIAKNKLLNAVYGKEISLTPGHFREIFSRRGLSE